MDFFSLSASPDGNRTGLLRAEIAFFFLSLSLPLSYRFSFSFRNSLLVVRFSLLEMIAYTSVMREERSFESETAFTIHTTR